MREPSIVTPALLPFNYFVQTCHYLGRFTRRTKVVSRSEAMVNLSIKLWWHLAENNAFAKLAAQFFTMLI